MCTSLAGSGRTERSGFLFPYTGRVALARLVNSNESELCDLEIRRELRPADIKTLQNDGKQRT